MVDRGQTTATAATLDSPVEHVELCAVVDVWTAALAVAVFVVLTRWKVSELWLIAAAGVFGLIVGGPQP